MYNVVKIHTHEKLHLKSNILVKCVNKINNYVKILVDAKLL